MLVMLGGCAAMPENMAPPPLPTVVTVPAGHRHALTLKALGTLNYECRAHAGMSGAYGWVLDAPDATLRHWSGLAVGRYYGGPTWEYRDGSKITARLVATSPAPGLPTLLLQASPLGGSGEFSDVTFIQRLNASGGVPTAPCDQGSVGRGRSIEFSADYLFYKKR
jgi:uncharacterized protein DUF3455